MTTHRSPTTTTNLELIALSTTTWRICDGACDEGDTRRIIGYLTESAEAYEVLWMRPHPGPTYRYDTFDAAIHATEKRLRLMRR